MRVTVCQLDNRPEAFDDSWRALVEHVRAERSELVLLPEMPFHPWLAADRRADPGRWAAAVEAHAARLARLPDLGPVAVASSRPVVDGGRRLNRAYVRTADGALVDVHDKYHLPDEDGFWEATWYERGDGRFETVEIAGLTAGFEICSELWFFDHARAYGRAGAHLVLVPRATPHGSLDRWLVGGRATAIVAGAYCLSSNLFVPKGARPDLGGLGFAIDPDGTVLATTGPDAPFATVEVDPGRAAAAKATYPRYLPD